MAAEARVSVKFRLPGGKERAAFASNASLFGCTLSSNGVEPEGSQLEIVMHLGDGTTVVGKCAVDRSLPPIQVTGGRISQPGVMQVSWRGQLPEKLQRVLVPGHEKAERARSLSLELEPPAAPSQSLARVEPVQVAVPRAQAAPVAARAARHEPSYAFQLEARCETFVGPVSERHFLCQSAFLSRTGCALVTGPRVERVATRLFVHFRMPSGARIRVLGAVSSLRPPEIGAGGELTVPGQMRITFETGQRLPMDYAALLEKCASDGVPTEQDLRASGARPAVRGRESSPPRPAAPTPQMVPTGVARPSRISTRTPQPQAIRGPIELDPAVPSPTPGARPPALTPPRTPPIDLAPPPPAIAVPAAAPPTAAAPPPAAPALDDYLRDYLARVETPPPPSVPERQSLAAEPEPAKDLGLNLLLADYVMSEEPRSDAPPDPLSGAVSAPIESPLEPLLVDSSGATLEAAGARTADDGAPELVETGPPRLDLDELTSSLQAQLDGVADRDGIGPVALGQLLRWFDRAAIFRVQRGQVAGWRAGGPGIVREAFDALAVPLDVPSPFLAVSQGAIHLGRIDESAQNQPLVDAMGGPADHAILVPVRLDDRVVAVVYGEAADEPAMEEAVIPCRVLADMLGRTFRRIILAMREKTNP